MAVSGRRIKIQTVLKAIDGTAGNISLIAQRVNCARSTIYKMMERHPAIKEALDEEVTETFDTLENKVYNLAMEGDKTMLIFLLKNSVEGKRRGWGERREVTIDWRIQLEQAGFNEDDINETFEQLVRNRANTIHLPESSVSK